MRVRWTLRPRGARARRRDCRPLPVGWIARLPSPSRLCRATCLAVARSRNGSCVINAIHYRPAVSLPKVRGCLKFPSPFGKVDCEARRMRSHNYRFLNLIRRSLCSRHLPQRGKGYIVTSRSEQYIFTPCILHQKSTRVGAFCVFLALFRLYRN